MNKRDWFRDVDCMDGSLCECFPCNWSAFGSFLEVWCQGLVSWKFLGVQRNLQQRPTTVHLDEAPHKFTGNEWIKMHQRGITWGMGMHYTHQNTQGLLPHKKIHFIEMKTACQKSQYRSALFFAGEIFHHNLIDACMHRLLSHVSIYQNVSILNLHFSMFLYP